jgi:outer membrane receptor protein involved in Fe transport
MVFAQTNTGEIAGVVRDPSGAVIPNATVTATNLDTGLSRAASSNPSGQYQFTALPLGRYEVSVNQSGFQPFKQQMEVTVGSRNGLDISLQVTGGSTVVEVVGTGGATVNTVDQQQSEVVNSTQIIGLPTLNLNPYNLVGLSPNVQLDSQAGMGDGRGAGFAINGQRSASTDLLLDGGENQDQFGATVAQPTPLDSVEEFRVITNGMTAEYGRAGGGVVNVATKSGSNSLHGSAYEFGRYSALASNTYYNVANGIPEPKFTRNQFGFSVGGPIIKDRLFFFDASEWLRIRSSAPQLSYVPDPSLIAASAAPTKAFFSAFGKLRPDVRQTGTATFQGGLFDQVTYNAPSDAGAGNPTNSFLNAGRVDFNLSSATQIFMRYAFQDRSDFAGTINTSPYAGFETGQTFYDNNVLVSLTHTFSPSIVNAARVAFERLNNVQPLGAAPVSPTLYMNNSRTLRINGTNIALPGYNEFTPGSAIPFGGPQNLAQFFDDFTFVRGNHTWKFGGQYIYTQDNRAFGAYEEAVQALSTGDPTVAVANFMAGTLAQFQGAINPQGKFPCPVVNGVQQVSPSCTVTLPVGPPSFSRSNLYNDAAAYGQDTWKIIPRLTLDLGLRWEYYGVQHNKNQNLDSNFYYGDNGQIGFQQIRDGSVQIAPQSPVGGLWHPRYGNFGPRVGFAYDLFGDAKTAVRGGYGIGYERNFNNVTYNVIQNPPAYTVISVTPKDVGGPIPISTSNAGPLGGSSGSKALPGASLRNVDENIKTAYVHQWNLGLEQQLTPNLTGSLTYNGARGIHQYSIANTNEAGYGTVYLGDTKNPRLNQQYTNINNRGSLGDSYYEALVAAVRGQYRHVTLTANYTYSHSIDTLSSTFSDEIQGNGLGFLDPFNPGLDRASSDYDARHRVSISMLAPTPSFKDRNWFWREVLGSYSVAPIFSYHTGYPFTIFDCTNSGSPYNCPRADVIGSSPKGGSSDLGPDTGGDLFNYLTIPAAKGQYAGPGTTGNSILPTCTGLFHQGCSFPTNMLSRNSSIGPSVWNWDLGIYKDFSITERVRLQLRGEFYDILNHKNFYVLGYLLGGADVSTLPTNAAGQPMITAQKGGFGNPFDERRITQVAVRITF